MLMVGSGVVVGGSDVLVGMDDLLQWCSKKEKKGKNIYSN